MPAPGQAGIEDALLSESPFIHERFERASINPRVENVLFRLIGPDQQPIQRCGARKAR